MSFARFGRYQLFTLFLLGLGILFPARSEGATPAQVESMLERAKAYLYSEQKNGTWEDVPARVGKVPSITGDQWGGQTALCVYSLLAAGDSPQDPRLVPAIDFLKKADIVGTYALGLRCQVWLLLPQSAEMRALLQKDSLALMKLMHSSGPALGFYDYGPGGKAGVYSLSRSQYGVLGVWAAAQAGVEIPTKYWNIIEGAWIKAQEADGGWRYSPVHKMPPMPGITAAGVATLYITQEQTVPVGPCKGNIVSAPIDRGLKWMEANFKDVGNPKLWFPTATLYAVERIGVASGRKYFGPHNWFNYGADWLLTVQQKNGSWLGDVAYGKTKDTCFAMLFLARGRSPIMMSKVEIPGGQDWNQRPRDIGNLSRWLGGVLEREINWQIVNLEAPVADLFDAPIVYMSGTKEFSLSDVHVDKLRQFVEGGGLILGHADCSGKAFAGAFRELATKMFPSYKFRELPENHLIYNQGFPRNKWRNKPSVLGLSNGVREFMLLIPEADPGKFWQSQAVKTREDFFQLGGSVYLYAVDKKNLKYRGDTHFVEKDAKVTPGFKVTVARFKHSGNWDPEPGGWRRLAAILHNQHKTALEVKAIDVAGGPFAAQNPHLTGSAAFQFSQSERDAVKAYVTGGGTLIIDVAGGSSEFANSAELEIKAIFTDAKLSPVPLQHPLFKAGNQKLESVAYRRIAKEKLGAMNKPLLEGISIGDRLAVIYSRYDLSTGLVGSQIDGIVGYDPNSATQLMTQILSYAAKLPAATTSPAAADASTTAEPVRAKKKKGE